MYLFNVHVLIRKGLGPEWSEKVFDIAFDDVENDVSIHEMKEWAKDEVRRKLKSSVDYSQYGENWIIKDVQLS